MDKAKAKQFLSDNNISFLENEPMKKHTTFKIGGDADILVYPKNEDEVKTILSFCENSSIPFTVIGKGSNLLVSDKGIEGIVISTAKLDFIEKNNNVISCGAGTVLTNLCNFALKHALSGLEFAYGIPGSVGGAVFMNAGAYGGEIKNCILSATVITKDGKIEKIDAKEMKLGYRTSVFKTNGSIILSAAFSLKPENAEIIKSKMEDLMMRRKTKQPLEFPSAGSTFKRPEGNFAGTLIESAGLKGLSVGDAEVSEKHAGFVINKGNAKCSEVLALINKIQLKVKNFSGVILEPEIIFIGRD